MLRICTGKVGAYLRELPFAGLISELTADSQLMVRAVGVTVDRAILPIFGVADRRLCSHSYGDTLMRSAVLKTGWLYDLDELASLLQQQLNQAEKIPNLKTNCRCMKVHFLVTKLLVDDACPHIERSNIGT